MSVTTMHKRVNITLPEETLRLITRLAGRGERSRFLDRAVRFYAEQKSRGAIRKQLTDGYKKQAEFDQAMAEEWFPLTQDDGAR